MITPDFLLEIAIAAEEESKTAGDGFARLAARHRANDAMFCAKWMEETRAEPCAFLGPFCADGAILPKRGDRMTAEKGAIIHSMDTKGPDEPRDKPSTRKLGVQVMHATSGYIHRFNGEYEGAQVVNPRVTWAGSGGYWKSVDANSLIEPTAAAKLLSEMLRQAANGAGSEDADEAAKAMRPRP